MSVLMWHVNNETDHNINASIHPHAHLQWKYNLKQTITKSGRVGSHFLIRGDYAAYVIVCYSGENHHTFSTVATTRVTLPVVGSICSSWNPTGLWYKNVRHKYSARWCVFFACVWSCICVRIRVLCIHVRARMFCLRMFCLRTRMHMRTYLHVHAYAYVHAFACACVSVSAHVCMHVLKFV